MKLGPFPYKFGTSNYRKEALRGDRLFTEAYTELERDLWLKKAEWTLEQSVAISIGAGLPEDGVAYHLDRCFEGGRQVPLEKRHHAVSQVIARGLTREEAQQTAEALSCRLRIEPS